MISDRRSRFGALLQSLRHCASPVWWCYTTDWFHATRCALNQVIDSIWDAFRLATCILQGGVHQGGDVMKNLSDTKWICGALVLACVMLTNTAPAMAQDYGYAGG